MNRSITYRLVFQILLVSSVATFVFTGLNFYRDYVSELDELDNTVSHISESYSASLSKAIFSYDEDQIISQLNGILALPHVAKLEITDKEGHYLYSVVKSRDSLDSEGSGFAKYIPESYETNEIQLTYQYDNTQIELGSLFYTSTSKHIYAGLITRALYFMLSQFIKTLAISFIFLLITRFLITKHLVQITNFLNNLDLKNISNSKPLELHRNHNTNDEIEILANKINELFLVLNRKNKENLELLKNAENKAEEHKKVAINAAKLASIGELAGGIAHEINNPISIISGYNSMLEHVEGKNEQDTEMIRKVMTEIDSTIGRISAITSSMLKYSRQDTNLQLLDLNTVIKEVESIAVSKIKSSGTKVILDEASNQNDGYFIYGNKVQVGQVLMNLINNAIDAMEENNIPIKERNITISLKEKKNDIVLTVTNVGPVIPKELRNKILQPFFTTKPEGKGTGLGLSICTTIMDSHNGTFKLLDTKENVSFEVSFPKPGSKA